MEIGYARVSTVKRDLARQLDALAAGGVVTVFSDKKSGATTDRAGLQDALRHARAGGVLVVHTLGRTGAGHPEPGPRTQGMRHRCPDAG